MKTLSPAPRVWLGIGGVRKIACVVATVLALSALYAGAPARADDASSTVECRDWGLESLWIPMSDGVRLRLGFELPGSDDDPRKEFEKECAGAPYPVVLAYSGYSHGLSQVPHWQALESAGYGVIGVSARGTGCSGGKIDPLSEREQKDVHEIIDWITNQWWSDGRVVLAGASYPAIQALAAAPDAPKALKAVVVGVPSADLYRDTVFPGGIRNAGISSFAINQAFASGLAAGTAIPPNSDRGADAECAVNYADSPGTVPVTEWMSSEWDEGVIHDRSPIRDADSIRVPVFLAAGWQDEVVGPRPVDLLRELRVPYRAILSNGGHEVFVPAPSNPRTTLHNRMAEEVVAFLDHHVRGVEGYDKPPVEIWWDSSMRTGPRWTAGFGRWPIPQAKAKHLFLSPGGNLTTMPPAIAGSESYAYVPASGQSTSDQQLWDARPKPGTFKAFTYRVEEDLVVAGSASLDLWLSSTAADTDLQIVLTEVRGGQEIYVAKGFLRASHRQLDLDQSTVTRPYHTHLPPALELEGTELVRVEIMPFAHAFRQGTELRLYIEAPRLIDQMGLQSDRVPAINTIHLGGVTPSALVLPEIPGISPDAQQTACDAAIRRLCRAAS